MSNPTENPTIDAMGAALYRDPRLPDILAQWQRAEDNPAERLEIARTICDIGLGALDAGGFRAPTDSENRLLEAIDSAWLNIPEDADLAEIGPALMGAVYRNIRTAAAISAQQPPPALAARTAWNRPPPDRRWLIPNWLPCERLTLFAGTGGGGKSRLALMLAYAVAAGGERWFPNGPALADEARRQHVVFASYEDEPDEIMRRLTDAPEAAPPANAAEAVGQAVGDRLHALDLAGFGPLWAPPLGTAYAARAGLTPAGRSVRSYCEDAGARLLILDSLAAVFAGNENDRAAVREFLSSWDAWSRRHDCAVLIVAHPSRTGGAKDGDGTSGSTDWHNGARSRWYFEPEEADKGERPSGRMVLRRMKGNYASPADPSFTLQSWKWWAAVDASKAAREAGKAANGDSSPLRGRRRPPPPMHSEGKA